MNMPLDARQRAMLQEMGVRVWWPAQADTPVVAAAAASPVVAAQPPPAKESPPPPAQSRARPPQSPAAAAPDPAPASLGWVLHPPRALFPGADPQHTPSALGACWLVVTEGSPHDDPFAGDAGRLLRNMLHALQLHRHPRVYLCALSPPATATATADADPADKALAQAIARLHPSVLLLLGRGAAHTVLQRSVPLGQLRGQAHSVAGVPAVVTYDAPYLLRAPHAKPGAWADLCLARSLAQTPTTSA